MISRRFIASAFAGLLFIAGSAPLAGAQSSQSSSNLGNNVAEANSETQLLLGSDGKDRATTPVDEPGIQGKKVELLPGDRLEVTEDGQKAHIINADGDVVGIFEAPRLVTEDGTEKEARFAVSGELLTLQAQQGGIQLMSCTRAEVGKWTYRVGVIGVCGALAAGTGGVAGGLCGLGAAWAEDNIPFDSVC